MKRTFLIATLLLIVSCSTKVDESGSRGEFKFVVIDGCEYIEYDSRRGSHGYGFFAYKGNCKYCLKRK